MSGRLKLGPRAWSWVAAAGVAVALAVTALIRFDSFTQFLDWCHPGQGGFAKDFTAHYYPMGRAILEPDLAPVEGYLYPACFALLLAPLCAFELDTAVAIWTVSQLAFAGILVLGTSFALRPLWPRAGPSIALLLVATSYPVLHSIVWGQISIAVAVFVLAAAATANRGRGVLAGALLGVVTAFKLYPGLLVLWFALRRQPRAVLSFTVVAACIYALIPVAILGLEPWFDFERTLFDRRAAWKGQMVHTVDSQSLPSVVWFWGYFYGKTNLVSWVEALTTVGYALTIAVVGLAYALDRRLREIPTARALPLMSLLLATPFFVLSSWPHYFAFLPPLHAIVLASTLGAHRHRFPLRHAATALTLASAAVASAVAFQLWGSSPTERFAQYHSDGALFCANAASLFACACLLRMRDQHPTH